MLKNIIFSYASSYDKDEDIMYSFIYGTPVFDGPTFNGEKENRVINFLITNKQEATHCLITISTETSCNENMWTMTNTIKDDYNPLYDEYEYDTDCKSVDDEEYILNYAAIINKEDAEEIEEKCFG